MSAMIELRGLTKVFGRTRAVDDLTCGRCWRSVSRRCCGMPPQ